MNVGVAFSNVGTDTSFTLDDSFFGGAAAEGDQVVTLDADQWNLNTYDKQGSGAGWLLVPADGGSAELVESIKIGKGDMLYYIPTEASDVTVSGKVADTTAAQSVTFDLDNEDGQWMFPLVNPYPVDTQWGELNAFTKEGDQLVTLDGDAWNLNTYDRQGDGAGWLLIPADGSDPEIVNEPETVALPVGGAAYYIPTETVTWTVTL